ncbi:MAG: germination protein YpeB [Clostridia bacterium]|nr:germination protein YpeB [Clostridia bacterium]
MKYEIYREETKKKRISGKDIAFIVSIVLLTLILALFVAKYAVERARAEDAEMRYKTATENVYRKSYYSLTYNMDGLDGALTKLSVARSAPLRQEYLSEVSTYSTAAAENLSNLAEKDAENSKLLKFINQTGDYAKYLDEKLARGGTLSEEDSSRLLEISAIVRKMKGSLGEIAGKVEEGEFIDFLQDDESDFSSMIRSFENDDVAYPSMIYDGPFSDSMTEREAKALGAEEINEAQASVLAKTLLPHSEIAEVTVKEGCKNVFETYDCELKTESGVAYVTLSKRGGFPVSMNAPREEESEVRLTAKDAEAIAEGYVASLGLDSMKAVWASLYENVYFINLAYVTRDVIVYPDLIKVKVDASKGEVVGMESLNYIFNHKERNIPIPVLKEDEARSALSEDIEVESLRLALVPTKGDGEMLTYEAYGRKGDDRYFVYIDAASGAEVKIMRVLDGERGLLLQ